MESKLNKIDGYLVALPRVIMVFVGLKAKYFLPLAYGQFPLKHNCSTGKIKIFIMITPDEWKLVQLLCFAESQCGYP